ncbi:hypothetical protein E2C01_023447 [Portunus trituberculatus]|uniref:Uncharacterized protein n=1 Tax=Portunus trituberculatus TaxID=210409 RepID=A0A5B7EA03_PORTR|nr:hypothetical protein [Portunus trituberculatus]
MATEMELHYRDYVLPNYSSHSYSTCTTKLLHAHNLLHRLTTPCSRDRPMPSSPLRSRSLSGLTTCRFNSAQECVLMRRSNQRLDSPGPI